jgi:hypothetical protein
MMSSAEGSGRCAILQFEGVHEEVVPSLALAMNSAGLNCHSIVNRRCVDRRGDVFAEVGRDLGTVEYAALEGRPDWGSLETAVAAGNYSVLLFSTFQRDSVANFARRLDLPTIGVVHNPKLFLNSKSCMELLAAGKLRLVCMAPHVAAFLIQRLPKRFLDRVGVVEPVFWRERPEISATVRATERMRVAIPGGVKFATRDYKGLLRVLQQGKSTASALVFNVLGGGRDRPALEEMIRDAGLSDSFVFAPLGEKGQVHYRAYYEHLEQSDVLLPLSPLGFIPYREHKITSAIYTAVGFDLPVVLDRWTSQVYRAPALVSDSSIAAAIEAIAGMTSAELDSHRQRVAAYRNSRMEENACDARRLLDQLF